MIDEGKKNDDNNHELPNNIDESIFFKHQITKLIVEVHIAVIQMVQLSTINNGKLSCQNTCGLYVFRIGIPHILGEHGCPIVILKIKMKC